MLLSDVRFNEQNCYCLIGVDDFCLVDSSRFLLIKNSLLIMNSPPLLFRMVKTLQHSTLLCKASFGGFIHQRSTESQPTPVQHPNGPTGRSLHQFRSFAGLPGAPATTTTVWPDPSCLGRPIGRMVKREFGSPTNGIRLKIKEEPVSLYHCVSNQDEPQRVLAKRILLTDSCNLDSRLPQRL